VPPVKVVLSTWVTVAPPGIRATAPPPSVKVLPATVPVKPSASLNPVMVRVPVRAALVMPAFWSWNTADTARVGAAPRLVGLSLA